MVGKAFRVITKTALKKKLDKICSKIVRARGKCEHCGSRKNLQTAHIFSRSHLNTRWDLDNLLCLCLKCHLYWAHKNPIEFAEWVKEYLGEEKYEVLLEAHNQTYKPTIEDLQAKLQVLEKIARKKRERRGNINIYL